MLKQFDWILLGACLALNAFGILSMYSTSLPRFSAVQAGFAFIGLIVCFVMLYFDMKILLNYAYVLFGASLFLTSMTLIFGVTRHATKAWFSLGGFTFQPSELLKLFFVMALARFFSYRTYFNWKDVLKSWFCFVLPVAAVLLLQNDLGTFIVFPFAWSVMLLVLPFDSYQERILKASVVVAMVVVSISGFYLLNGYQIERIAVFPEHLLLTMDRHHDIGYQVDQSLIAIGSAGIMGKGLHKGTQSQFDFLPEQQNDFIYASIVEEMGILVGLIIISLYGVLLFRLTYIVQHLKSPPGVGLFIVGSIGVWLYHILQNIGMNLGMIPVTGISLPFVSYGGSFLVISYLFLGCIQSIIVRYYNKFSS